MSSSEKTATDLEWPVLLERLASRCTSNLGAQRTLTLQPSASIEDAQLRMQRLRSAMELASRGDQIPLDGIADVGEFVSRIARDSIGMASEFHALRAFLVQAKTLRRFAGTHREEHPVLSSALHCDPNLDKLLAALEFAIDPDGGLADRSVPEQTAPAGIKQSSVFSRQSRVRSRQSTGD